MTPSLRPHQEQVVQDLRKSMARHRAVILQAMTGFGKSRVAKWIVAAALEKPVPDNRTGCYLLAVHRRGLVDNLAKNLEESPAIPFGVIMSGTDMSRPGCRLQLASIDTLNSWYPSDKEYTGPSFDLVVFDECHSHLSKLRTFLATHNNARAELGLEEPYLLGLSATPECEGLADVFNAIVSGPTAVWLQQEGFAARYRYMTGTKGKLGLLKKGGSEFTQESVEQAMANMAGDFVKDWKKNAQGRPTVGFFPRRKDAQEAMSLLVRDGVDAEYLDGETPDDERRLMFAHLQRGDIDYICNVGVIERGTDIPAIGCVQLCTAVGSLVRYRQMIGRGSRTSEGKEDCLILDHGDNIRRHGFFEDEIAWTLDRSTKNTRENAERPPVECPKCGVLYRGGKCKSCGYEPTAGEKKQQGLSFDGRPLVEIEREERQQKRSEPEELMTKAICIAARSNRTVAQAARIAESMARREGVHWVTPRVMRMASGHTIPIPWGTPEVNRKAAVVFPWAGGKR